MKNRPLAILLLVLCLPLVASAKDETFRIFQDRRITVSVPEGFSYETNRTDEGLVTVKITDAKQQIDLQVSFLPDRTGRLANETGQKEFLAQACQEYAEGSVEQSYEFENLRPQIGSGLYCVFTDKKLVNKQPPAGEYVHVTSGVKAWPGCFLVFTLLSNDTDSKAYRASLRLLKDSFIEVSRAEAI
jgi:hypothetical protein